MIVESILETLKAKYVNQEIQVWVNTLENGSEFIDESYNDRRNTEIIQKLINVLVIDVSVDYEEQEYSLNFIYNNTQHFINLKDE